MDTNAEASVFLFLVSGEPRPVPVRVVREDWYAVRRCSRGEDFGEEALGESILVGDCDLVRGGDRPETSLARSTGAMVGVLIVVDVTTDVGRCGRPLPRETELRAAVGDSGECDLALRRFILLTLLTLFTYSVTEI